MASSSIQLQAFGLRANVTAQGLGHISEQQRQEGGEQEDGEETEG